MLRYVHTTQEMLCLCLPPKTYTTEKKQPYHNATVLTSMILCWNTFYCVLSYISETHTRSLTQLSTVTENKHPDEGDKIMGFYQNWVKDGILPKRFHTYPMTLKHMMMYLHNTTSIVNMARRKKLFGPVTKTQYKRSVVA